jgi:tight adherence protein B
VTSRVAVGRTRAQLVPDFEATAAVVQRLAVLLDAGIAPVSAWRHVAADARSTVAASVAASVVERGGVGLELATHLLEARALAPPVEREAWAALAAAWWVAVESGAPLAPTLQRFAASLRELAQSLRDVEVALAGPLATSRIVLALPAIGLLFGALLGFDAPRILVTTPAGWACVVIGVLLVVCGVRWNRGLIRRARQSDPAPGLALELLAIAVSGGASLDRSRTLVDLALREADLPQLGDDADAVLSFSRAAGVPAAALLHAEAQELRRRARTAAQLRAAELGTRLLLPLGVCILPAFVALGVAPIVIAILSSSVAQL